MTGVPGIDRLGFRLEGAVGQDGVVDGTAQDAPCGGRGERVGIFVAIQGDDGKALADVADEEHCLLAADPALARHPRQSGVDLGQTVRSAAAGRPVELDEDFLTWAVVDVVPVEQRN